MNRSPWQTEGREPDYRFSLANERTFLAWIRTALAVLAGGILLHQFGPELQSPALLLGISTCLMVLAAFLSGAAYYHWKGNEISMRHDKPLPGNFVVSFLSIAMSCVAAVLAILVVFQ